MVFSSLVFLYLFLPACLISYYIINNPVYRNWVLIVFSLVFYAWGEPVWIVLLLFTAFFDYFNGLLAEKYRGVWQSKAAVVFSITINLLVLGFFKYSGFLVETINQLLGLNIPFREFSLPLGISFYTFQSISYVVDVYRGEVAAQRSPYNFLLYVALFHHLVAGPIIRYKDIEKEIAERTITFALLSQGINRFIIGLGKKVIIANNLGEVADIFLKGNLGEMSVLGAWFGITLFALQIYFDFSGYSDMAIGLGKMFGFNYKENFNYPYMARSATDFWRRWHISLGSFFRDYVYIPLGGNRTMQVRNLFIVWFLTGLWHGASWNFVVWGLYYGLAVALEKWILLKFFDRLPRIFSHAYLILVVLIGWVFFYYTDFSQAVNLLYIMFGFSGAAAIDSIFVLYLANNFLLLLAAVVFSAPLLPALLKMLRQGKTESIRALLPVVNTVLLLISTMLLVGKSYNPFLYFRF